MKFLEINYVELTEEQKEKALMVLGAGNILLKKWSAFFRKKEVCEFRAAVLRGEHFIAGIPTNRMQEFREDLPIMTAARTVSDPLFGGRTIELAVIEGFSALAKKHALVWSRGKNQEDYIQEAYLKILDAMYSWLPEHGSDICTYIWNSLKNQMIKFTNKSSMLCPLANSDLKLLIEYKKVANSGEHMTFDDIIEKMNLSQKKAFHLSRILSKVETESQYDREDGKFEIFEDEKPENLLCSWEASEILNRSGLSGIEREVLDASMKSYRGWQSDFARNHINPNSGKPYSRMRITQILDSARAKVIKVMEEVESKAA
jgi:DNA-directed RNA polymerase specialized sigma subunit